MNCKLLQLPPKMIEDERINANLNQKMTINEKLEEGKEETGTLPTNDNNVTNVYNEVNKISTEYKKLEEKETISNDDAKFTAMDIELTAPDIEKVPLITEDQSAFEIKIDSNANSKQTGTCGSNALAGGSTPVLNASVAGSSLSLLAEYDSSEDSLDDSSTDDEDNSDDTSDSSDEDGSGVESSGLEIPDVPTCSTDSSDSDSDSDACSEKSLTAIKKKIDEIEDVGDDDEELLLGEDDERRPPPRLKVPGELGIDDLPPIENLHITVPEDKCEYLGKITSIVEQLVLVESIPNKVPFDLDTVLFLDKGRTPLGKIFDVMGPVHCPIYCIRFNSHQDILDRNIVTGLDVYCAPSASCSQLVILSTLTKMKGSDASWLDDIEPPERYLEYSDDEQERAARKARKNKNSEQINGNNEEVRPQRGPPRPMARGRRQYQQPPPHHQPQYGPGNNYNGYGRRNPHFRPQTPPQQFPPQYFRLPPTPAAGPMYQNPYANVGQFYANPFAFTPQVNYPPFNPTLFGQPPPPPPPPSSSHNRR